MYDAGCKQNRKVEKYGLKTLHSPKQVKELSAFEKELIAVVKDIKFRKARSDFQTTLQDDIKLIHNSKKTRLSRIKEEHNKLLQNAITLKYKKTNTKIKEKINKKGRDFEEQKLYTDSISMKKVIVFSPSRIIKRTSKTTQQPD